MFTHALQKKIGALLSLFQISNAMIMTANCLFQNSMDVSLSYHFNSTRNALPLLWASSTTAMFWSLSAPAQNDYFWNILKLNKNAYGPVRTETLHH